MAHEKKFDWSGYEREAGGWKKRKVPVNARCKLVNSIVPAATFVPIGGVAGFVWGPFNSLREGPAEYERIGRRITLQRLRMQGFLYVPSASPKPDAFGFIRFVVVYDAQSNLTTPQWQDVIYGFDNVGAGGTDSTNFLNPANIDRFKLLADWIQPVHAYNGAVVAAGINPPSALCFRKDIKIDDLPATFASSAVGAGSIATGSLWCMAMCDPITNLTNPWAVHAIARLTFCDA